MISELLKVILFHTKIAIEAAYGAISGVSTPQILMDGASNPSSRNELDEPQIPIQEVQAYMSQ